MNRHKHTNIRNGIVWVQTSHNTSTCTISLQILNFEHTKNSNHPQKCTRLQKSNSGLCSSIPFFTLPFFTFLDHGTFQDCCCLFAFDNLPLLREEHEDDKETRCMVSEFEETVSSDGCNLSSLLSSLSSLLAKSTNSRLPFFIHPSISLFTSLSVCSV